MASSNLFAFVPSVSKSAVAASVDKGPRPWDIVKVLESQGIALEDAQSKALASFLRVDAVTPEQAAAFYSAACAYAAKHQEDVTTKDGRRVRVISGLNMFKRPAGAIRAFLEGKPCADPLGMACHVADLFHGAKPEVYGAFFDAYRAACAKPVAANVEAPPIAPPARPSPAGSLLRKH